MNASNVSHKTGYFKSEQGNKLFEQHWQTENPKANLLIVHGLGEHSTRYTHVAEALNAANVAVYAYDHYGHGQSEGKRAYIDSFDIYRADLEQMIDRVRSDSPSLPLFALAHSMGGEILVYTLATRRAKIDGAIISAASLVKGDDIADVMVKISKFLSWLAPKLPVLKLNSESISRDPKVVANYEADPLVFRGGIPARTGAELIRGMEVIQDNFESIHVPLLIMHGKADKLTNMKGSVLLYERAASQDKTLKLYDDLYHEILNEPEKEIVINDMVEWLNEHVPEH